MVALKMILAGGYAGPAELQRFRTEAQAIAALQHPNIVQIYEVGEHDGLPFFSLEFCAGGTLAAKLQGTPLPPQEAAALVEKLARAMAAVHQAGVIHRDLKPGNILLAISHQLSAVSQETKDAQPKLMVESCSLTALVPKITDFGLAKKLDAAGQTATGAVMGTPSYMAPEQAGGKAKELGPACDIYSLGAILYECLTGQPPFKAGTPLDTVLHVITEEPVPPRRLRPKVPRDLETICLKCLHKDPRKRFGSAEGLAGDLRHFLNDEPIQARRAPLWERGWKWGRRKPMAATLVGLCLLGIVLSMLAVLFGPDLIRDTVQKAAAENYYKGIEAYEAKQWNEAFKAFSETIRLQPENSDAFFYRGMVFIRKRDFEEAANDLTKVVEGNPKYPLARAYINQLEILRAPIEMEHFTQHQPLTLKEALGLLYGRLLMMGKEFPILVDTNAFKEEDPDAEDVYDTPVQFEEYPRKMKVAEFLQVLCAKVKTDNATYVVTDDRIWLTTQTAAKGDTFPKRPKRAEAA